MASVETLTDAEQSVIDTSSWKLCSRRWKCGSIKVPNIQEIFSFDWNESRVKQTPLSLKKMFLRLWPCNHLCKWKSITPVQTPRPWYCSPYRFAAWDTATEFALARTVNGTYGAVRQRNTNKWLNRMKNSMKCSNYMTTKLLWLSMQGVAYRRWYLQRSVTDISIINKCNHVINSHFSMKNQCFITK